MNIKNLLIAVIVCFQYVTISTSTVFGQPQLRVIPFASGFNLPVDIAHAGDERLFIVEKAGLIRILDADREILEEPFLDLTDQVRSVESERGLLGLAFHPNYEENGWFFVNYSDLSGNTQIVRFTVSETDPNIADPESETPLLSVVQDFINHNGGDLNFGPDGYLYIGLGDGGSGFDPNGRAQDGKTFLGKMLRIDVNEGDTYQIPEDNPFINDTTVLDEVWATGLRNPWRYSFDRETGDMWIGDVGQGESEEISFQPAGSIGGENYGWVCFEGTLVNDGNNEKFDPCDELSEPVFPVFEYGHNVNGGFSVTGGYVYRGSSFPDLIGNYVLADYSLGRFWTIAQTSEGTFTTTEQGVIFGRNGASTFGEDVNGELYVAHYENGDLFQVGTESSVSIKPSQYQELSVFPNPTKGTVEFTWENKGNQPYTFSVLDLQGKIIFDKDGIRGNSYTWDASNLNAGVYMVQMVGETLENGFTNKLVISK